MLEYPKLKEKGGWGRIFLAFCCWDAESLLVYLLLGASRGRILVVLVVGLVLFGRTREDKEGSS